MKPYSRIRSVGMVLIMCTCIDLCAADEGTPRIEFERTTYQFVRGQDDSEYTHTFIFTNRGDATLKILDFTASCGCLSNILAERSIPPGESGAIEVSLIDKNLQLADQTVVLRTNDPITPVVSLTVSLIGASLVETFPSEINLGAVEPLTEIQIPFSVLINDVKSAYEVTSLKNSFRDARVRHLLTHNEGTTRRFEYVLIVKPDWKQIEINEIVTVRTNVPEVPLLELPVRGQLLLPYKARPQRMLFGIVSQGTEPEFSVILEPESEDSTLPVRVACADKRISARLETDKARKQITLFIRFSSGQSLERLSSTVSVYGAQSELLAIVPVQALIFP